MIDPNLTEELAEQVIDRLISDPYSKPQPVKEDREDRSSQYVRTILIPQQDLDREDDR